MIYAISPVITSSFPTTLIFAEIERILNAYAPDVNQIAGYTDLAPCMLTAYNDVTFAHLFNVIAHIARSNLKRTRFLLDILLGREKLLTLLLILFLLCHFDLM